MATMVNAAAATRAQWPKRYPPLLAIALAVLLAVFTLPSALNLPQANPGQVAEYAPVPGNSNAAPPGGNFAALGLGEGGQAEGGTLPQQALAPGSPVTTTYDCVGSPPRQTIDPLSPPCVPSFTGNNGGATYQGVTGSEITILFHFHYDQGQCPQTGISAEPTCAPAPGYYDMSKSSDYQQWVYFLDLAAWQSYFNKHYQTYHRFVHFWAYLSSLPASESQTYNNNNGWGSCADGEQDAATNYKDKHPFAVLDEAPYEAARACYRTYMVQHNVLVFGGQVSWLSQSFYQQFHGLVWDWSETIDRISENFTSAFCARIANQPTSFSGDKNGIARKFGIIYYSPPSGDPTGGQLYADWDQIVENDIKQTCGVTMSDRSTYPVYQAWQSSSTESSTMLADMQRFQTEGITTIVFLGASADHANDAHQIGYHPEWVLVGDDINDSSLFAIGVPSDEEGHSIVITQQPLQNADGQPVERACYEAITEAWPTIPRDTLDISIACGFFYDDLRQVFTGIQVAGPGLTPASIDEGFHAIPAHASTGPDEPACFYPAGDYTCFKDAVMEYWDPNAQPAAQCSSSCNRSGSYANGCWRMWRGGFRYLPGEWPKGDAIAGADANTDICNLYQGGSGGVQIVAPQTG